MENIQGPKFPPLDSWEMFVNFQRLASYPFARTEIFSFCSGCRKERFLVRQTFDIPISVLTVLASSTIIQEIDAMRKAGLASLGFFYCDFREDRKKDLRGLLSSLLIQLCHQSGAYGDMLFSLYSEHAKGSHSASDSALAGCLKGLLNLPGLVPIYLIVDALDECPNSSAIPSPRDDVLSLIEELIKLKFPNLRICVTSQPEANIKDVLDPLISHFVSLHDEIGHTKDIKNHIESVLDTHAKTKGWKAEHKQLILDDLTERANGM